MERGAAMPPSGRMGHVYCAPPPIGSEGPGIRPASQTYRNGAGRQSPTPGGICTARMGFLKFIEARTLVSAKRANSDLA